MSTLKAFFDSANLKAFFYESELKAAKSAQHITWPDNLKAYKAEGSDIILVASADVKELMFPTDFIFLECEICQLVTDEWSELSTSEI